MELKRRNSGGGPVQSGGEVSEAFAGNIAEKSEREMDLFVADPTHRTLRETVLEPALKLCEPVTYDTLKRQLRM